MPFVVFSNNYIQAASTTKAKAPIESNSAKVTRVNTVSSYYSFPSSWFVQQHLQQQQATINNFESRRQPKDSIKIESNGCSHHDQYVRSLSSPPSSSSRFNKNNNCHNNKSKSRRNWSSTTTRIIVTINTRGW